MMAEKHLNALMALVLASILLGAFAIQIFENEQPCPLCLMQRLGMLGVAAGALLNVRCGLRPAHYGLCLLSAVYGGFVALRQIALHVCPGFPTFGKPFWGLSLYTWSFITFASVVAFIGILLFLFDGKRTAELRLSWFCHLAFICVLAAAFGNIINALILCGISPCEG